MNYYTPLHMAVAERNSLAVQFRIDRRSLVSGLFYGMVGMRVGGTRRL